MGIDEDIEDNPQNYTRFLVIDPHAPTPDHANRSSLVLTTDHQPGALARVLTRFAQADINLVKLQSRPIIGQPWNYKFYLVVDTAGTPLEDVLSAIQKDGNSITILGQYRAAE